MKKISVLFLMFIGLNVVGQETEVKKNKLKIFGNLESNSQWYLNDTERGIIHDSIPLRSNNYLSLNVNYGKLTVGSQIESYQEKALLNFNPEYEKTDFGTYFVNFKSKFLEVTAGHFYEQFGSGLALRSWEDRSLGINNAIKGGKIVFKPVDAIVITALYGKHRSGFKTSDGQIYGINTDVNISQLTKIESFDLSYGFSYVGRKDKLPSDIFSIDEMTSVFSNRISFSRKAFYFSAEYNEKTRDALLVKNDVNYTFVKPENALLVNIGYSKKGLGIDATVRRIENMFFLSEREPEVYSPENSSINYNDKLMNFIPSLTKQHHSNLANIYTYQAQARSAMQFDEKIEKFGEIGGQFDLFYDFKKGSKIGGKYGTKIALNASVWNNLKADFSYIDDEGMFKPEYKTKFLEGNQKYFSDYNIEISKKITPKISGLITYIRQYYNDQYIRGVFQKSVVNTDIVSAEALIVFPKAKSITVGLEHMWADADRLNWAGASIEYNHNSHLSFFATDMFNYGFKAEEKLINETDLFDIHFYNVGTAYKFKSTRLALNYGRQRGGLVCAGGVCRFVPPSTGLGLQISTSF